MAIAYINRVSRQILTNRNESPTFDISEDCSGSLAKLRPRMVETTVVTVGVSNAFFIGTNKSEPKNKSSSTFSRLLDGVEHCGSNEFR